MFKNYKSAEAQIKGGNKYPNINGTIHFKERKNGIIMTVNIKGLPLSGSNCVRKIFWNAYT